MSFQSYAAGLRTLFADTNTVFWLALHDTGIVSYNHWTSNLHLLGWYCLILYYWVFHTLFSWWGYMILYTGFVYFIFENIWSEFSWWCYTIPDTDILWIYLDEYLILIILNTDIIHFLSLISDLSFPDQCHIILDTDILWIYLTEHPIPVHLTNVIRSWILIFYEFIWLNIQSQFA